MATLADMKSAVSKRLLDAAQTAVSSADVVAALNEAIRYYRVERFAFNEYRAAQAFSYQTGNLTLPTNFLLPSKDDGAFVIEYSQQRYPLLKDSAVLYDDSYMGNGYGRPTRYAKLASGGYYVYPLPDRDYTGWVYYLASYPDLILDTDSNDFSVHAYVPVELRATARLISELRQDSNMGQYYFAEAQKEADRLKMFASKANGTGSLQLDSCLI